MHVLQGRITLTGMLGKRNEWDWICGLSLIWRNHFIFLLQTSGKAKPSLSNPLNFISIYLWAVRICKWEITGSPHFLRQGTKSLFFIKKSLFKNRQLHAVCQIFIALAWASYIISPMPVSSSVKWENRTNINWVDWVN